MSGDSDLVQLQPVDAEEYGTTEDHRSVDLQPPPKIPFPSCRFVLTLMAFIGFFNAYSLRVNLSVAIVAMVNHTTVISWSVNDTEVDNHQQAGDCRPENWTNVDTRRGVGGGSFNWDTRVQGQVLAAFFYGYLVTQILGGWLADRVGGKWFFGVGIFVTALTTLLIPAATYYDVSALIATRVIQGLGEGAMIPAMHALYASWTPPLERTRTVTLIFSGTEIGTIVGMLLSGLLCDHVGWPSVFYVFGAIGTVWSLAWMALCHNSPAEHPRISAAERQSIESTIGDWRSRPRSTPWRGILTSVPVLATSIVHFAHNYGYYTLLTGLPKYMHDVHHFNLSENGLLSSLPYVAAWVVMLSGGQLADWMRAPGRLSTGTVRKLFCAAGMLLPGLFLIISGFLGCNRTLAVMAIVIAVGCSGLTVSGYSVNLLDLAPDHAGTLMGLTNSFATVGSMIAPHVVGAVLYHGSDRAHWQIVFYIAAGIYCFGVIVFALFGSGEEQEWAKRPKDIDESREKGEGD